MIENLPEAKVWENFRRKEKSGNCVIGYIGWIRERRPVDCLFEAVAQLRAEGYDISVFFAGFGPEEAEVKAMAKGRNDTTTMSRISQIFTGGWIWSLPFMMRRLPTRKF